RIGQPINQPQVAVAKILPQDSSSFLAIKSDAESIIREELENISSLTDIILKGEAMLF
ncbi:MAG TPA: methionine adenosyltransferase, partial [Thermoprotei archaeon]|nr:methionine adenosyltransferase [Thermoprotei archaeon]